MLKRGFFVLAFLAIFVTAAPACGGKAPAFTCDDLCSGGGYGSAEETSEADGSTQCVCSGIGTGLLAMDCNNYCEGLGRSADKATLEGETCSCAE